MAVYIVEKSTKEAQALKSLLKKQYPDTDLINLKSLLIESGPTKLTPSSIIIYKGHYHDLSLKNALQYCRKHQIALLAIVDKESFQTGDFFLEDSGIVDIVTEPTETELRLRVHLLLTYQKEVAKRIEKEKQLEGALSQLTEELEFAKKIQHLVLPRELSEKDIKVRAIYEPSQQLSGDLYFWIKVAPQAYGLIIIDVSGHGVHAALVSMAMRALFPGLLKRVKDPKRIAQELNEHMLTMFEKFHHYHFVTSYFTAIILNIDTKNRTISYVNAGHQPGLFMNSKEQQQLESTMVPIGLIEKPSVISETIHYDKGARLLLFTDGLVELPYSHSVNEIEQVQEAFAKSVDTDEQTLLEQLLENRRQKMSVSDDICAIAITLY